MEIIYNQSDNIFGGKGVSATLAQFYGMVIFKSIPYCQVTLQLYDAFSMFPGIQGQYFMAWVDGNDDDVRVADLAFTTIPEPSTYILLSLAGLLLWRQRVAQ